MHDGSVLDLLYGNYTFVNPPLARHYGMPEVAGDVNTWVRVDDAGKYGRGGILPMAVFMTANSPGLRTSPVKRGNWVVQKVLGIRVPPPPPVVPELPSDESKTDLPIRRCWNSITRIRSAPAAICASIPSAWPLKAMARWAMRAPRIWRGGRSTPPPPIRAAWTAPACRPARLSSRITARTSYVENLSRKLLAYALNRSLQLSDESLVDKMKTNGLAADGYRFRALVEAIVISPQFLNKRRTRTGRDQPAAAQPAGHCTIKIDFRKGH